MDPEQFRQLTSALSAIAMGLQQERGFTFDQTVVLIGMCATGLVFLGGVAWGIVRYIGEQFDKRDEARAAECLKADEEREKDREAFKKELELLHSRIANIRREFVVATQYDKDIGRIEAANRSILDGINAAGSSLGHKVDTLQNTVVALQTMQSHLAENLKAVQATQSALLGVFNPNRPAPGVGN
jgi:hypothetical protein